MADHERERVGFFRQRWAQENFRSHQTIPQYSHRQTQQEIDLFEVSNQRSEYPETRGRRSSKRSWRDHLRLPTEQRLAPVGAHEPSNASTSLRSPVDSQNNTIYSHNESLGNVKTRSESPAQPDTSAILKPWLDELYILSWLTFFSLLGTLARIGVEAITQYPDAPVTSRVLWANLGGSFLMGFLVEDRNLFGIPDHLAPASSKDVIASGEANLHATHLKHKKTIPLYIGLAVGFCGSFTSFSSFVRDAFLAMTNDLAPPSSTTNYKAQATSASRNGGFSFLAMLAILVIHPAVSFAALKAGGHFALLLRPSMPRKIFSDSLMTKAINPLFVFISLGCWLFGALFLTIFPPSSGPSPVNWRARATVPLLFAPPGCILRYYLSRYLNRPSMPKFPLGTFIANVFGTFVLGIAWDLQHARSIGASITGGNVCAVLEGVQEGFCGCLTTVSTWIVELNGLGWKSAWIYGASSVAAGLAGLVIIMGSTGWTIGFAQPACG